MSDPGISKLIGTPFAQTVFGCHSNRLKPPKRAHLSKTYLLYRPWMRFLYTLSRHVSKRKFDHSYLRNFISNISCHQNQRLSKYELDFWADLVFESLSYHVILMFPFHGVHVTFPTQIPWERFLKDVSPKEKKNLCRESYMFRVVFACPFSAWRRERNTSIKQFFKKKTIFVNFWSQTEKNHDHEVTILIGIWIMN